MKLLKKIAIGLVIAVVLFVAIGFLLPANYEVSRSTIVDAPPEKIFVPVARLSEWPSWTVWNNDNYPELDYSYSGSESGVGAVSEWTDPGSGNGRMEVTTASPETGIEYTLKFEGFEPAQGAIRFAPGDGSGTEVTMEMKGGFGNNPIARYFGLLMPSMMGPDLEACLAGLKEKVESSTNSDEATQETDAPASSDAPPNNDTDSEDTSNSDAPASDDQTPAPSSEPESA